MIQSKIFRGSNQTKLGNQMNKWFKIKRLSQGDIINTSVTQTNGRSDIDPNKITDAKSTVMVMCIVILYWDDNIQAAGYNDVEEIHGNVISEIRRKTRGLQ